MARSIFKHMSSFTIGYAFFIGFVCAKTPGTIYPNNGPYVYSLNLSNESFPNNIAGSTTSQRTFSQGGDYKATCFNDNSSGSITGSTLFSTVSNLAPAPNSGYILNEYVSVDIWLWIAGNREEYVKAPFYDESNEFKNLICANNVGTYSTGSKGKIQFKLLKPIVNGLSISQVDIVDITARIGNPGSGTPSVEPMARVKISSLIITVQDKCVVNAGNTIQIEFNAIPNINLTGNKFTQNVPIRVECEGGSFSQGNAAIALSIRPNTGIASFNSNYLATNKENLGISLVQASDGRVVVPGEFYKLNNFDINSLKGEWDLIAAPVINSGVAVTEGDFNSSSTVVMEFQ